MIADANKEIDALKEQVAANKEEADKLHREMLETISGLASGLDALEANLGSLKSEFEANKAEVKGELKTLQDNIDAANANIAKNTVAIEKLADLFENTMAKLITGIEINYTYNPPSEALIFPSTFVRMYSLLSTVCLTTMVCASPQQMQLTMHCLS